MQTPKLPIQFNANPAPSAAAGQRPGGGGDAQFSAALSREVNQRQQKTAMPAPAKAPPPAKAEQAKPAEAAGAKPAGEDQARPAATAGAAGKDEAAANSDTQTAADAAAAAAADAAAAAAPALDMLALVASLNLPATTQAAAAPAVATDGALQSATAAGAKAVPGELANMMGKLDGKELDVAAPLATDGGSPLGKAVERVVADDAPVQARPDPATGQPKGLSDASQFASLRPRDAVRDAPEPAALKELGVTAPTAAPLQQAALALAQAATGVASDKIAARVGTPGWDQQVGQKIVWMVAGQEQSASLTLNPPDMGPMQVVLSVNNDQATVTFSAAQPEVRQALEDAMPKLREMMNESGIALGNASVNDGSAQQQAQAEARQAGRGGRDGGGQGGQAHDATLAPATRRGGEQQGLVDTFA